jgi:hypothetical protein
VTLKECCRLALPEASGRHGIGLSLVRQLLAGKIVAIVFHEEPRANKNISEGGPPLFSNTMPFS